MADTKISALTELTQPATGDWVPLVDTTAATTKKLNWAQLRNNVKTVGDFGAVGDGATDDADAIILAIEAAGTNGTVQFTSGKTYLIKKSTYARPGQTWVGYGATIKRADEISSALTGNVSAGSSVVVPVTDGSKFTVGQEVAGWEDDATGQYSSITYVTAINANNVTIANLSINLSTASSAVLTAVIIPVSGTRSNVVYGDGSPDDVTILGLTFDGNRANNESATSPLRWELQREISSLGARSVIDGCKFNNAPCEGVVGLGDFAKVINTHFSGINGNAIHTSAGQFVELSNLTFNDCNTLEITPLGFQGDGLGHQDGAISYSSGVQNHLISNIIVDTALRGVGGVGGDAVPLMITGARISNCTQGPFRFLSDGTAQQEKLLVSDANIESCGTWLAQGSAMTASGHINDILFSNMIMNRTLLSINNARKLTFKNCQISYGSAPVKIASISTANPMVITTQQPHKITDSSTAKIYGLTGVSGNDPSGAQTATVTSTTTLTVPVDGAGFSATLTNALIKESNITDVLCTVLNSNECEFDFIMEDGKDGVTLGVGTGGNNKFRGTYKNQWESGITITSGNADDITDISANFIAEADAILVGTYTGIQVGARAQVHDCIFNQDEGLFMIQMINAPNHDKSTFLNNQFYGDSTSFNLSIHSTAENCVVMGNLFEDGTNTIGDATTGGTTIAHNNYVIGTDVDITPV